MSAEWHYRKNGQQHGPVSAADLKALAQSGELTPTDTVWKSGMAEWKVARSIKSLFPTETPASPPPSPLASLEPNNDLSILTDEPQTGVSSRSNQAKLRRGRRGLWIAVGAAGLLVFAVCIICFSFSSHPRLSEDYYPLVPGRERKFEARDFGNPQNAGVHHTKESANGSIFSQKVGGDQLTEKRKVEKGYVLLGNERSGGSIPIVKFGAGVGDTWEIPSFHKNSTKIGFVYESATTHKGKPCALVVQTELRTEGNSFVASGEPWYKVKYWLVKGVGLVKREQYRVNKGKWELRADVVYEEW